MLVQTLVTRLRVGLPAILTTLLVGGVIALTASAQPAQPAESTQPADNQPATAANDNRPTGPRLVDLIWKFKVGDTATYVVTDKTTDRISDRGRQITDDRETTLIYEQKVETVDDATGAATLRLGYKRVKFKQQSSLNPQAVTFDSDANEDMRRAELDPALMPFAALKDGAFSLKLSPKGDVSAVSGYSALVDKMFKNLDEPSFTALKATLKSQFSDEAMTVHLNQIYHALPGKAVPIGETWKRDYEVTVALFGRLKVEQSFKLTGIETNPVSQHAIAVVTMTSRYTQLDPGGVASGGDVVQGLALTARLNEGGCSLSGTFRFDTNAGVLTESELRQEIDSQLTAKTTDAVGVAHEMNAKVTAIITLKRQ